MLGKLDAALIHFFDHISLPLARIALFVVFFWFGALKLFDSSPANPLVSSLLERTLPFMSFETFIIILGVLEMVIGLLFLFPRFVRIVMALLAVHMFTTLGPLVFLPEVTWQTFLVPTLEGQYIIKNVVIVALAVSVAAHAHPWKAEHAKNYPHV